MAKSRIAYNNLLTASGVTISSSAEATGYPDDNLASPARWKKWRSSTTTGDQWVRFDRGSNGSFQVMAAISPKLHSGGTLVFQANATDVWTSPTVDQTITAPSPGHTGVYIYWLPASQSLRWFRFFFDNVGAVSDYVEIGAVFAGTYFEPTISVTAGSARPARVDLSTHRVAIGGQRSSVRRAKQHRVSGHFWIPTSTERNNYATFFNSVGSSEAFILGLEPDDSELTFYGTLADGYAPEHFGRAIYQLPFTFLEDVA